MLIGVLLTVTVSACPPRRLFFSRTSTDFPRFRNCTAVYVPAEPPPRTHTSRTIRRASDAHALRPVSFAAAAAAAELVATLRTSRRRTVMFAILWLGVDETATRLTPTPPP